MHNNKLQILMSWETTDRMLPASGGLQKSHTSTLAAQTVVFGGTLSWLRGSVTTAEGPQKSAAHLFFNLPYNFLFLQQVQDKPLKPSVVIKFKLHIARPCVCVCGGGVIFWHQECNGAFTRKKSISINNNLALCYFVPNWVFYWPPQGGF